MTEPTLDLQRAIGARLLDRFTANGLVAPSSIVDGSVRPEEFPAITFGTAQTIGEHLTLDRRHSRTYVDLHVWTLEGEHVQAKQIVGAIRDALRDRLDIRDFNLVDLDVASARFLRDPSGTGHAVVTIEALVARTA